ncbi:hypothetical protein CBL_12970 [Carabus blaptoides fortunei]
MAHRKKGFSNCYAELPENLLPCRIDSDEVINKYLQENVPAKDMNLTPKNVEQSQNKIQYLQSYWIR